MILPGSPRTKKKKVKERADLRTPLAFLLGRLHFEKDFQNFQSRPEGAGTWVTADAKSRDLPYTNVAFEGTPQFQIRRLQGTYQHLSVVDFQFDREKLNPSLDARLFQVELPPATLDA